MWDECVWMIEDVIQWSKIYFLSNSLVMLAPRAILILTALLLALSSAEINGSEAYYLSPKGLARYPEVENALSKISGQIRVKRTTYNHSSITYILDNVTIGMAYNDAKQVIQIPQTDNVRVSGGRVEFTYRFNYTKIENRNNITGYGYGSVLSDSLVYYKDFFYCESFPCWRLLPGKGVENLTLIGNRMKIKRFEPFNQSDLENIQDMLDQVATSIDPANFKVQILSIFNQIFPQALQEALNHEVYGEKVEYSFHSNTHGEMTMNIIRNTTDLGVAPTDGFRLAFATAIEGFPNPKCTSIVPKHYTFDTYGSPQNFHLHCIYQTVVKYLYSKGWLNANLDSNWQSNSFQFYAGDLFDLINNLYLTFSPRAILDGSCVAQEQGLKMEPAKEFDSNSYGLDINYKCSLKGTNKEQTTAQILKFTANVKLYIKAEATTHTLSFKIVEAEVLNLNFEPVGSYYVSNINLAMFKANSIIRNVVNTFTFGTGFPTLTRQFPKTRVYDNFVLYYDASNLEGSLMAEERQQSPLIGTIHQQQVFTDNQHTILNQ